MGGFFATCLIVTFYKKDSTPLSEHVFYILLLFACCNIIIMQVLLQTKYAFLLLVIYTSYIVKFDEILMVN